MLCFASFCTQVAPTYGKMDAVREDMMQRGAIKKHGKFWVLKYREDVLQNGVRVRKEVYKKLAPANSREYQTKESVQKLADVILAPLNAGLHQAQSVDTLKTFLESFVAKGQG